MITNWNKITDRLPIDGNQYLVWNGSQMYVSRAELYAEEYCKAMEEEVSKEYADMLRKSKGRFSDFGQKDYFDSDKLYWAELPLPPGQEPKIEDPFAGLEEKSVYLRKDGHIVGFHAIGEYLEDGQFMQLEIWGNEYNEIGDTLGQGSFRVFGTLDAVAKEMVEDGWEVFEGPKK